WTVVYSIGAAFIGLRGTLAAGRAAGKHRRQEPWRLTGLPVGVSGATTNTPAQPAAQGAATLPQLASGCARGRVPAAPPEQLLADLPVGEVWGIGHRMAKRLNGMGIVSIKDFRDSDERRIRDNFSIVQLRALLGLRGASCIPAAEEREMKD